jgi:HEAT repeat protein
MKTISPETREKIGHLLRGSNFWNRMFANTEEQVELLHDIGYSCESAAIPEIAWLLVGASGPVWRAAAEAVHRLLATLAPLDLAALDQRIREIGSYDRERDRRWRKLRPSDLSRFVSSEFAVSLLGLASFHSSGYAREAAVEKLSALDSGQELPFLLIRLNDWVVPVREAAARAVNTRLRPEYAHHFLRNLRLVLRLESCGRANRALVDIICGLLRRAECQEVLQAGMKSSDRALRRASFQLAANAEQSARAVIIRAALADTDPVARAWAVKRFLPEVTAGELPSIAAPMLADRFMPVRRDTLWALATKCPDFAAEPLKRALLDSHFGMREVARCFLAADGHFDIRKFYLDAVQRREARTLAAAIRGLGETGKPEDAGVVSEFLNAPKPSLRRAATYAVGKLDAEHFVAQLMQMLADEMPGVSREALKALLPKARHQSLDDFWKLFANDKRVFVRRNTLVLMLRFGKWEKLPPLLLACADEDKLLAEIAAGAVHDWIVHYNGSYAEPTRRDFENIESALRKVHTRLPRKSVDEIRACLKIYFP